MKQRSFYKYRSLITEQDRKFAEDILCNNQLYFASAESFNDPFEFHAVMRIRGSREQIQNYFESTDPTLFSIVKNLSDTDFDRIMLPILEGIEKNRSFTILKENLYKLGILCLSTDAKNINLWSIYASSHRGICFEFNGTGNDDYFSYAEAVSYRERIYEFNLLSETNPNSLNNYVKSIATTKYRQFWNHESEYRIVHKTPDTVRFNPNSFKAVYLGCKFNNNDPILYLIKKYKPDCDVVFLNAAKDTYELVENLRIKAKNLVLP